MRWIFIPAAKLTQRKRRAVTAPLAASDIQRSTVPRLLDGIIIYIKPACYGDKPRDSYEYFKEERNIPAREHR